MGDAVDRADVPREVGQRPCQDVEIFGQGRRHERERDVHMAVVEIINRCGSATRVRRLASWPAHFWARCP